MPKPRPIGKIESKHWKQKQRAFNLRNEIKIESQRLSQACIFPPRNKGKTVFTHSESINPLAANVWNIGDLAGPACRRRCAFHIHPKSWKRPRIFRINRLSQSPVIAIRLYTSKKAFWKGAWQLKWIELSKTIWETDICIYFVNITHIFE